MPFFTFFKKCLTIPIEAKKIHKTILSLRNAAEDDHKNTQVILRAIGIKIAQYWIFQLIFLTISYLYLVCFCRFIPCYNSSTLTLTSQSYCPVICFSFIFWVLLGFFVCAWLRGRLYSSMGKHAASTTAKGYSKKMWDFVSSSAGMTADEGSRMQETAAAVTSGPQCLGHSCPYQSLQFLPSSVSLWAGILQPSPCLLVLPFFLLFLPQCPLNLKADDTDVSFRLKHAAITYSKQSDQLWIDASAHCKMRLCWWRLRATTFIYGHHMYLKKERSLLGKTYPSSETAKSGSSPRAYDYPIKAVEQIHSTWRESPLCSRHYILSENWWTLVQSWHYYRRALTLPPSSTLLLERFIARLIYYDHSLPTSRIHSSLGTKKGS